MIVITARAGTTSVPDVVLYSCKKKKEKESHIYTDEPAPKSLKRFSNATVDSADLSV